MPVQEVMRQEKKYAINQLDSLRIRSRLKPVMMADAHNDAEGYLIRSLYFDTPDNQDFIDKLNGLELRRKIRLRAYGPEDTFASLEMKQKEGPYQRKRSLRLSREDARRLSRGDYSPLLSYSEPFAAECYGLMTRQCYLPRTIVEYHRLAYIAKENRIRITLDQRITANEAHWDLFADNLPLYPVLDPFNAVLEVKYNGFLLSYIRQLINTVDRSELSVSKYCLSRRIGSNL